jgi:hypothetical protein
VRPILDELSENFGLVLSHARISAHPRSARRLTAPTAAACRDCVVFALALVWMCCNFQGGWVVT